MRDFDVRVGPGTPLGRLLRCYWHPIAYSREVEKAGSLKPVELLGERLVLFRTLSGALGLIKETCPHRRASLAYGFVENHGIRCAYHGWHFTTAGTCTARPFEDVSTQATWAGAVAYQVRESVGLVFAYLGVAEDVPALPMWELLCRSSGYYQFHEHDELDCSWLYLQENAADVTHTHFLHGRYSRYLGLPDATGFSRSLTSYGFMRFAHGLLKTWRYRETGPNIGWGNLLLFPTILYLQTEIHWRVPLSDTRTKIFILEHVPTDDEVERGHNSFKRHMHTIQTPNGRFLMDTPFSQDAMAVTTQHLAGSPREDKLVRSDRGILIFHSMLKEAIDDVQSGRKPLNWIDDGSTQPIDLSKFFGGISATTSRQDQSLFDQTGKAFTVIENETYEEYKI